MSWRFYPLADHSSAGIMVQDGKRPFVARFLTPEEAKAAVPRKIVNAA